MKTASRVRFDTHVLPAQRCWKRYGRSRFNRGSAAVERLIALLSFTERSGGVDGLHN